MKAKSIAINALGLRASLATLALLFGLLPASTAVAEMVGSVSIALPPPAGFCKLTEDNASDRRVINTIAESLTKVGSKLLVMSADCRQLADWRARKRPLLDDYAQYQVPLAGLDSSPPPIAKTCAAMRASGEKFEHDQSAKTAVESIARNVKLNEQKVIGVLAEDPDACYVALLSKWQTEAGTPKTQLTLLAVTTVKDRSIFLNQYSVYDAAALDQQLAKVKATVAALQAANR